MRPSPLPQIMGASDVARALGIRESNLDRTKGLPPHSRRCSAGRIWVAADIRRFARQRAAARERALRKRDDAVM